MIPFRGSIKRYLDNPNDPNRGKQLAVDMTFDVINLALIALGVRAARGARVPGRPPVERPVETQPKTPVVEKPSAETVPTEQGPAPAPKPGAPATAAVKDAAVKDMMTRFGLQEAQARTIVEGAMGRGSDVVVGGSRARGNAKPTSDIDIGYNGLTKAQAGKVTKAANKVAAETEGGIPVEETTIVPGNQTKNIPQIQSPEEFFMRTGTRNPPDPRAGEPIEPSGYVKYNTDGSIIEVKPDGTQTVIKGPTE